MTCVVDELEIRYVMRRLLAMRAIFISYLIPICHNVCNGSSGEMLESSVRIHECLASPGIKLASHPIDSHWAEERAMSWVSESLTGSMGVL